MLKGANAATIDNQVSNMIAQLRTQNVDGSLIVDALVAAYCPVIAADTGLTTAQKKARIDSFSRQVTALVFPQAQPQQVDDIIVNLPMAPDLLQKVDEAARAAQMSRDAWLARTIQKSLPPAPK
jgi:hypothetical protein